jgi:molybdopterin-guanine dinucleotide biosynthesis protein A
MKKLTGIVLGGGKSCRFGEDKGLCTLAGKPMIDYPLLALKNICDDIIISSNDMRYKDLGYKMVSDEFKNIGPIGGIYSALNLSETSDNIIVSCDMPFISVELLQYIFDNKNNSLIASAFEGQYVEPLCSYYHKDTLPFILEMITNKKFKLQKLLDKANYKKIIIDNSLGFYENHLFLNINTQLEYNRAEKIINKINQV